MIPHKEKILLSLIGAFFAVLAVWVIVVVMTAPPRDDNYPYPRDIACTTEAMVCPDGSAVGRTGPNCEFAPCEPTEPAPVFGETRPTIPAPKPALPPKPIPDIGNDDTSVACTMDAMMCPDGSYVGRTAPKCEFAPCPTPVASDGTSGSCTSDNDCALGYSCEDISPVVREGTQNLRCWKNGAPRPICLSGETLIATPRGDVIVKNLKGGEVVWSVNARGEKVAVPVLIASYTEAPLDHHVVHLVLADGRELFVSPGHPVADGRTAGSLKQGDTLDSSIVRLAALVPYDEAYTYDILPAGGTGMYFANGILLQSTLR